MSARSGSRRAQWLAFGAAAVVAVAAAELGLRLLRPVRCQPYPPGTVEVFEPPATVRGVSGAARFTANRFGCRGPDPAGERHRLLVIGGGTAACTALDDAEQWPQRVMDRVNAAGGPGTLWVTNAGMPGRNSGHHVMHARYLVPRIPELDHVLVYCGLNDVVRWLGDERSGIRDLDEPAVYRATLASSFAVCDVAPPAASLLERSRLWRLLWPARAAAAPPVAAGPGDVAAGVIEMDEQLAWIEAWRRRRERAAVLTVPPAKLATFPAVLACYERNLRRIVAAVRAAGAGPILVSQAMHWRALSEAERAELWLGVMDSGQAFVDPDQMQDLVGRCNDVMRRVAAELDVPLLDLAAELRGPELFYDGCHFTERGADEVAAIVAEFLVERVDLAAAGRSGRPR